MTVQEVQDKCGSDFAVRYDPEDSDTHPWIGQNDNLKIKFMGVNAEHLIYTVQVYYNQHNLVLPPGLR